MNPKIDLEQPIMVAWQTSEDIDLLFRHYGDAPNPMTEDEVMNALLGIKTLHDMRMSHLMEVYCQKMELNQYCTDPDILAERQKFMHPDFPVNELKKGKKK
jgi:hypothetical protein